MDLVALSRQYAETFAKCDLDKTAAFFSEEFTLTDPGGHYVGKKAASDAVKGIFGDAPEVGFKPNNIFADPSASTSVIEFVFKLPKHLDAGEKEIKGVDVVEWTADGKMKAMRAYVY